MISPPRYGGIDGCRAGWVCLTSDFVSPPTVSVYTTFADLLKATRSYHRIAIDIPIGLLAEARPGGRTCDAEARKILGRGRCSSVFSPPCRAAVYTGDYREALRLNRESSDHQLGISKQVFNISDKIREVDELMTPKLQTRIREVHPEMAFLRLNDAMDLPSKKLPEGALAREEILARYGLTDLRQLLLAYRRSEVLLDDLLDAAMACVVARMIGERQARRCPQKPELDDRGLKMEINY